MTNTRIGRLGCMLLVLGSTALPAQDREVAPLPSLAPLIERVAPAVVNISVRGMVELPPRLDDDETERFFERLFPDQVPEREFNNAGSGVIVDADQGYLLTNHHVVEQGGEITVTLVDNRSFVADVIGSDPESDLAVLKIDGGDLSEIPFTSTDDLKVGDYVVAIGNPFGFANTVTAGIVSGLGRYFIGDNDVFEDFIQTDASINPGNSGGALINLEGNLVGINSAIFSGTGGNVGVGFAIPSEMVLSVMEQLIERGEVRRGLLGVYMSSVTPALARDIGLGATSGALVTRIQPDSAAEAAGLRIYDVIVGVDGEPVADSNELRNEIAMLPPGRTVALEIQRDGRRRTIEAELGARPTPVLADSGPRPTPRPPRSALEGVELASRAEGLEIVGIGRNSQRAVRNSLAPGDVIVAVNRQPVRDPDEARRIVDAARTVTLEIESEAGLELLVLP